jgi:hypothetical protein
MRLPGVCDVGKVFVPLKFDALETVPMRLYGQILFQPYFTRLKMMVILGLTSSFCTLAITSRFC